MAEQKQLEGIRDHDNYRKMNEPFASAEDTQTAADGFWKEFYELRNKYKIPDIVAVLRLTYLDASGETVEVLTRQMCGTSLYEEVMAAWLLGQAQADRQEMIGKLLSTAPKSKSKR